MPARILHQVELAGQKISRQALGASKESIHVLAAIRLLTVLDENIADTNRRLGTLIHEQVARSGLGGWNQRNSRVGKTTEAATRIL
jgi:hypothetical protein